ncbi:MAG: hypothetical protein EA370_02105 [Wenzhouxiangella sp.]|nr:MAG: hypothetical protein EA370_02105 [Wenzhouxiangella sp.]
MQVGAAGKAGVARAANHLSAAHLLARAHRDPVVVKMGIDGHAAVVVQNAHVVGTMAMVFTAGTRTAEPARLVHDHPGAGRVYGRTDRHADIDGMVIGRLVVTELPAEGLADQKLTRRRQWQAIRLLRTVPCTWPAGHSLGLDLVAPGTARIECANGYQLALAGCLQHEHAR